MQITVLGAGISGVTTALRLQSALPKASINITAEHFNSDTLSAGAAGIFRPGSGLRGGAGQNVGDWIKSSYNYYSSILASRDASVAGIMRVDGYLFSSGEESVVRNPLLENLLPIYRMATEDEITEICPDSNFKHGAYFQTMVIESEKFLPWGIQKFLQAGGTMTQKKINSFQEVNNNNLIINCTGLGARKLCQDNRVVPIRGQVFKVRAPWIKMFYYGDYDTYIIPTSTQVTLGGTRNFDSWNTNSDEFDEASILARCSKLIPNLKNAEIIRSWVGLRPYRDQVRVEFDDKLWSEKGIQVIHNYGHGGYGITASGTSEEVVKLVLEKMRMNKSKL